MTFDIEAARQLYQPPIDSLRKSLPDIGNALETACCELACDCSLDRLDRLAAKLTSAQTTVAHLRKAIQIERHGMNPS